MKSSRIIAIVIAVLALVWIGSGFIGGNDSPEPAPEASQTAPEKPLQDVRVREITAEDYVDDVIITGRSRASRSVQLKAETGGQVISIVKEEGDPMAEHDVLAEIELRDRQAKLSETRQRVNQRQIEYDASKKLEEKGFNSKVRLAQARADLENAKAELRDAEVSLNKTKIEAPFDGVIFRQDVEVGDYLAVGDPVFTVVDLDPIELVGYVSERRLNEIEVGKEALADFLDGQKMTGKVSYVAPAADPQTRTFQVVISAENPDMQIKEGLTAKIYIPAESKRAHKISPSILSLNDEGKIGVKIVNDQDVVEFIPVQILADKPEAMWIYGPPEKARFITVGQDFVIKGQKVNPVPSEGDGLL